MFKVSISFRKSRKNIMQSSDSVLPINFQIYSHVVGMDLCSETASKMHRIVLTLVLNKKLLASEDKLYR